MTTTYSKAQNNFYFPLLITYCRCSAGSPQDFRLMGNKTACLRYQVRSVVIQFVIFENHPIMSFYKLLWLSFLLRRRPSLIPNLISFNIFLYSTLLSSSVLKVKRANGFLLKLHNVPSLYLDDLVHIPFISRKKWPGYYFEPILNKE